MKEIIPQHIAIIPDGNRRWSREHNKAILEGHQAGAETTRRIVIKAADSGIKYLSIWGMSLDNFRHRSLKEVAGILSVFREEFTKISNSKDIHNRQVKVSVLGRWQEKFPSPVRRAVQQALDATSDYSNYYLNIFLAYNGTDEMIQAVQQIVSSGVSKVTPSLIKQNLLSKNLPPVDLLIRTGGEPHLSAGFMMWDIADAQLHFTNKFWPAFSTNDFDKAVAEYSSRQRRFGG